MSDSYMTGPKYFRSSTAQKLAGCLLLIAATMSTAVLPGCSLFSVYTIDLPQGTPITKAQAGQVKVGMTQSQVTYLLGSPALKDTLAPNRWDYIYDYQPGTEGRREGRPAINNASQHLIIIFDGAGNVSRIEGIDSLPGA